MYINVVLISLTFGTVVIIVNCVVSILIDVYRYADVPFITCTIEHMLHPVASVHSRVTVCSNLRKEHQHTVNTVALDDATFMVLSSSCTLIPEYGEGLLSW